MEKAKVAGKGSARTTENKGTVKGSFLNNMESNFMCKSSFKKWHPAQLLFLKVLGFCRREARGVIGRKTSTSLRTGQGGRNPMPLQPTSKFSWTTYMPSLVLGKDM